MTASGEDDAYDFKVIGLQTLMKGEAARMGVIMAALIFTFIILSRIKAIISAFNQILAELLITIELVDRLLEWLKKFSTKK